MIEIKGQTRVIIEQVQPQVDGGRHAAKRTVGESVTVTAHIFGDGHDHIRAHVLYRKPGAKEWHTVEMTDTGNDEWYATFAVTEKGVYTFTVMAWIDHFDTWYDGFRKKAAAGVDVHTELLEGVLFLKKFKPVTPALQEAINQVGGEYTGAIAYVLSDTFRDIVHEHPLIEYETRYAKELVVNVEHTRANFSTWYELFPRSASLDGSHGTFKDVIRLLPRIAGYGLRCVVSAADTSYR